MNNPKITVIMPVYNGEKYLSTAIDSILNQTYQNFEFIIINDGSTDKTSVILNEHPDKRIKVIDHKRNKGIVQSLNEALAVARGVYIARMDADDISLPSRLGLQLKFMEANKKIVVCAGNIQSINSNGEIVSKPWWVDDSTPIEWQLIWDNVIPHPTVMMRKSLLPETVYRDYKYAEDYDLWLRLISKGKIVRMSEILVNYRLHEGPDLTKHISMDQASLSNYAWVRSNIGIQVPIEHRWLTNFSGYGEDFGELSFENALTWLRETESYLKVTVKEEIMIKTALHACDKLVFKDKVKLIKKSICNGSAHNALMIIRQTFKQYARTILRIK